MAQSLIYNTATLPLTKFLASSARPLHLTIADVPLSYISRDINISRVNQTELLSNLDRCDSVSISLVHGWHGDVSISSSLVSLMSVLSRNKNMKAVQLVDGSEGHSFHQETMQAYLAEMLREMARESAWNALEEFQINVKHLLPSEATDCGKTLWRQQNFWSTLKRLSVVGPTSFLDHIFRDVGLLSNLVSLKVRCAAPYGSLTHVSGIADSPFLQLSRLRELELELEGSQVRINYFANPNLRRWKCHSLETITPRPVEQHVKFERTPEAIANLVKLCPMLQQVEIDVGDLSNLWNGCAIAGIDVDVQVYSVLASLARLSRLRKLRLFPPYCEKAYSYLPTARYRQPLSDEQASKSSTI